MRIMRTNGSVGWVRGMGRNRDKPLNLACHQEWSGDGQMKADAGNLWQSGRWVERWERHVWAGEAELTQLRRPFAARTRECPCHW